MMGREPLPGDSSSPFPESKTELVSTKIERFKIYQSLALIEVRIVVVFVVLVVIVRRVAWVKRFADIDTIGRNVELDRTIIWIVLCNVVHIWFKGFCRLFLVLLDIIVLNTIRG